MKIKTILMIALVYVAIGSSLVWGQCGTWTKNTIRNCNGIDYELWNQNNSGTVTMKITGGSNNPNGGTFEATWSGTENILTRAGKKWGSSSTTTARSVGNISLDFEATWSSSDNVKMLGIYGWAYYPSGSVPTKTEAGKSQNFSNQIEYYIIQDRGSFNPASGGNNAKKYGEGTIDGIAYEFWVADRISKPMLTGNGNFKQYFSFPKSTSSHRQKGIVSISKHFEAWDKAGMKMLDCALYEVAMKVESYTGSPKGSGSAKVTKNLLTLGGGNGDQFHLMTNVFPTGSGTVTKSPNETYYNPDASVQLTATPSAGWKFVGWTGDASGSKSSTTLKMSKDRTVTAKFELVSGVGTTNLIKDGDFPGSNVIASNDGVSWKLGQGQYWGNSEASSSVSNGTATINVTTIGTQSYQPQLIQYGLPLEENLKYKLTFKAKAAAARKMAVSFQQASDPWTSYATKEFALTTTKQDFEYIFTMASATDLASQFAFNLGQATGGVDISDVKLVHTTDSHTSVNHNVRTIQDNVLLASLKGRILKISPATGSKLLVRVVDVNGKVVAKFNVASSSTFSLSNISSGRYLIDIRGAGVKQSIPIVLD